MEPRDILQTGLVCFLVAPLVVIFLGAWLLMMKGLWRLFLACWEDV